MYIPRTLYRGYEKLRPTGHRQWPVNFTDRLTSPLPGRRELFRLLRERGDRPDPADARFIAVEAGARVPDVDPAQISVTWAGHASCVVRIGGATVLTDPVWSRRIPGTPARLTPPGVAWEDLPAVDAVLISHNHYDHLDAPTLRRLPRSTPMLVPAGLGWWLRRYGFTAVVELDWWEATEVAGVEFTFTPAHHWSRRTLFDTNQSLWGGWMMRTPGPGPAPAPARQVFFAGDSAYGPCYAEIGARLGPCDVALMPVGAFEPQWFMKPVHMNPAEAVQACGDLGAARMVPIHWGTFMLSSEPLLAPRDRAITAWAQAGRDRADFWDLAVGGSRTVD